MIFDTKVPKQSCSCDRMLVSPTITANGTNRMYEDISRDNEKKNRILHDDTEQILAKTRRLNTLVGNLVDYGTWNLEP